MGDLIVCEHSHGGTIELPKDRFKFRVGAYALVLHEGKMLMIRIRHTRRLFVTGGGVDPAELLVEGLHREVMEETGLQVEVGKLFCTREHFYYWQPTDSGWHALGFYYECTLKGPDGPLVAGDPDEGLPEWVPIPTLLKENLHGSAQSVILEYLHSKGHR
jgi:8-oxo-dGTP pyrophosphatase MutT (NUDIX family)